MEFVFEGVKPECLNGRFFNVDLDREEGILRVKEFFQQNKSGNSSSESLLDRNNIKVTFIKMAEDYCRPRIVGKPVCIGCRDCLLLFQYISIDCRFIRFFLVDLLQRNVKYFEDTQHFFNRDMASVSPLESIVCADKQTILIRLPQTVLTCRKWSKLMQVDYSRPPSRTHDVTKEVHKDSCACFISGTVSSCLRDRKFQAITAHPTKPCVVYTAVVDEFCSKCKFTVRDIGSKAVLKEKTHRLGERSKTYVYDENSDSDEEETYFLLHQCTMTTSREGDIIALCCFVADNKQSTFIKLFLYDTESIHSVGSHVVKFDFVTLPLMKTEFFSPLMSVCDEHCSVCHFKRGSASVKSLCTVRLSRQPNLMRLCRSVILQWTPTMALRTLPLPTKVIDYLHFSNYRSYTQTNLLGTEINIY